LKEFNLKTAELLKENQDSDFITAISQASTIISIINKFILPVAKFNRITDPQNKFLYMPIEGKLNKFKSELTRVINSDKTFRSVNTRLITIIAQTYEKLHTIPELDKIQIYVLFTKYAPYIQQQYYAVKQGTQTQAESINKIDNVINEMRENLLTGITTMTARLDTNNIMNASKYHLTNYLAQLYKQGTSSFGHHNKYQNHNGNMLNNNINKYQKSKQQQMPQYFYDELAKLYEINDINFYLN
jgi:hypothetical protein